MGVERVLKLRDSWLAQDDLQSALNAAFDQIGFDQGYVDGCIASAATGTSSRKTKYIKDNLWGMIEVPWSNMRLLDCPIMQRLRGIKQLGLSYLTYPAAEHSRFVHSLGVAHVVDRFLKAIEHRATEPTEADDTGGDLRYVRVTELAPLQVDDIVHAAILHDVGHMPFSHATELALARQEDLFRCGPLSVGEVFGLVEVTLKSKLQLSEALSLLVLLSKRFGEFYHHYVRYGSEDPNALLRIACLIAGLPPVPRLAGVTELISAASVDADKVDYVNRDARACGIPVGVDVSRVFLRSGFVLASRARLEELKEQPEAEEILFVVNASGMDTLDEIMQARAALYQRVYLHAVTRTAEAVLAKTLHANAQSTAKDGTLADAIGLWAIDDNTLLARLVSSRDPNVKASARRLKNRWLPKKACIFSASVAVAHMPLKLILSRLPAVTVATIEKQIVNTSLELLRHEAILSGEGLRIEDAIKAELDFLISKLPEEPRLRLVPRKPLDIVATIGIAYMDHVRKDCIVLLNGELLRTSDFTNSREQQDASDIFKAVGYIMCDPDWRPLVLLAARTVLCAPIGPPIDYSLPAVQTSEPSGANEEQVMIVQRMLLEWDQVVRRTGVKRSRLEPLVHAAKDAGYFDDKPLLAPPERAGSAPIIAIARKLDRFEGQRSWRVRNETVAAFVNQFPPRLREDLLATLSQIKFFSSQEIVQSILGPLSKVGPAEIVNLSPNSGANVRTTIEREAKGQAAFEQLRFSKDIRDALNKDAKDLLVLVDDNISSATQARAQFLAWSGKDRANWPRECQEEDGIYTTPMPPELLERFKHRPFKLSTCVGRKEAEEKLRPLLHDLGFIDFHGVEFSHPIEAIAWPPSLRSFLEEVGCALMARARFRKDPTQLSGEELEHCKSNAFGYGNVGGLIATETNVPTATVTAIWLPGMFKGSPWMPLMLRQNKFRHLVLG